MVYLVSYDLNKLKNYPTLYKLLENIGTYYRPLESLWWIETSMTESELNNKILSVVDKDDAYYITTLYTAGGGQLNSEAWVWINSRFPYKR